jgi:hypothetical protein
MMKRGKQAHMNEDVPEEKSITIHIWVMWWDDRKNKQFLRGMKKKKIVAFFHPSSSFGSINMQ